MLFFLILQYLTKLSDTWAEQHRYGDIASQLPAVLNVLQLFDSYMEVEQIKNVAEQLERLKQRLAIQIVADLKHSFQVNFFIEGLIISFL